MSSSNINPSEKQHFATHDDDTIDVKKIFANISKSWYLFVLGVAICLTFSYIYAHYASADWHVSSKILVEESKNGQSLGSTSGLGADFSSVFSAKSSADNEIQMLKSRSLMENTVKKLQLNVRLYNKSGFKYTEIYQEAPFTIKLNYKVDTLIARKYIIAFQKDGRFSLSNAKEDIVEMAKPGETIRLNQYDLTLNPVSSRKLTGEYAISIESVDATVGALSQNFSAGLSDKLASTIDLGLSYPSPKKGEVILEEMMNLYLLSNLENKVKVADNTIAFIDARISLVLSDLNNVEENFERYKTQNNIADISAQSKVLVGSASDYFDKLNQQETQLRVFNDLEKILKNPQNKATIPSSMIAPADVSFGQSINAYNSLLIERDKQSLGYTNSNPIIENYDQQIETARQTLLRSVESYTKTLQASKAEIQKQNGTVYNKLQQVPAKERGYLDFQRKQSLKQDLYLFLLQKREETAISKTSTISSSRIVDHAKSEFGPYKPKKSIIYIIGVILGIVLPCIYLLIKSLLNVKINSKQDILNATTISIVGEIGHNDTEENLVTTSNSRTVISEQFRNMRTKINYLLDASKPNVILFTSSMGGEGKSFLSVNLGSALALTGKKIVFMELDLRKPKLSEIIGHDHNVYGYSNYAVSEFTDINKLVKPVWFDENCSLISSGPIPPNPTELLSSDKLGQLIKSLKEKFDYIIIDCAPIGLVTDALLVEKFADLTFYVVRENFTYKNQINIINDLKQNGEAKNLYIILNDIKTMQSGYSSYGYGLEKKKGWGQVFSTQIHKKNKI
jgi:tyrosine-protein kinase Etk/Wzc